MVMANDIYYSPQYGKHWWIHGLESLDLVLFKTYKPWTVQLDIYTLPWLIFALSFIPFGL